MDHAAENFKAGMRQVGAAVSVIAAQHAGRLYGLTATAVCSVTMEPPTLLVCVNRQASTHAAIKGSASFSVNVLGQDQEHLARDFSGQGEQRAPKFSRGAWTTGLRGVPILADCIVSFVCRPSESIDVGSHTVFFGRVVETVLNVDKPCLGYVSRKFIGFPAEEAAGGVTP